jgi:hypothetical protein
MKQAVPARLLDLLHQHPAVRQAADAQLSELVGGNRVASVVVEDKPLVKERA